MLTSLNRILSRINEIQSLLGEQPQPNKTFDEELRRYAAGLDSSSPEGVNGPSSGQAAQVTTGAGLRTSHGQTPSSLEPLIEEASARTGLQEALISAVMATESGYQPDAVSPAGALGLMQLMPGTAQSLGIDDPLDPRENILGGAEYLRQQLSRFGTVEKALAAYNAGPQAVQHFGGIPPFRETQSYVRRVLERLHHLTSRRE
jgi:soluble lytic murein transglycosylase-like protein